MSGRVHPSSEIRTTWPPGSRTRTPVPSEGDVSMPGIDDRKRIFAAVDFSCTGVTVCLWAPNPGVRSTWNLVPLEANS